MIHDMMFFFFFKQMLIISLFYVEILFDNVHWKRLDSNEKK